jgi:hypothetical protein
MACTDETSPYRQDAYATMRAKVAQASPPVGFAGTWLGPVKGYHTGRMPMLLFEAAAHLPAGDLHDNFVM